MEQNAGNETYSEYIKKGKEFTENTIDQARTDWENNELLITKAIGSGSDIDKYAVLAAAVALGESDYEKVVNDYRNVSTRIDSTNPALIWTAMGSSETIIKMYVDGTLESYVSAGQEKDENGNVKKTTNVPAKANLIPEPTIIPSPFASHFERIGAPLNTRPYDRFAIHHTAGTYDASMQAIHEAGLGANDCRGFNYTYAIYSDGSIHEGRPEKYLGSHTGNLTAAERARGIIGNAGRIGITFPGNFNSTELTQTQLDACISLIAYKCKQYNITPTRKTIMGHYEVYGDAPNPSSWSGCPGTNVGKHLDDIVNAVASGHLTGSATTLWVDFIELVIKGLQKDGKTSLDGLDLFPKICYMYVKLMADTKNSSFDSDQGWGFPFTNEIINSQKSEKCVFLTGKYREQRSDHLHEGIDLQVGDNYNHPKTDVPFCAVKDGTVYTEGQWCNAIYVKHNDGTFSRYLHCRRHLKKQGDTVRKGEQLGIVGGMDNSGQESYAVHLHLEIGKVIEGKTPLERTVGDDCGINPLDCFKPPNSDSGGVPMWTVV